ncbi:MAG: hypothetical protein V1911_01285 [Candidatus Micrarchaeota archaeon]
MDTLSLIVLLIVGFLAWQAEIPYIFWGIMLLTIIAARSVGIAVIIILGVGATYFLKANSYFLIIMLIMAGMILAINERNNKKESAGAGGYGDLSALLGGGGGGQY